MSIRRLLPAVLALAVAVSAPAVAQKFIPQSALVAMIEVHKASIIRYIDVVPDSVLGFRPTPGVRTYAEQIEHAAVADAYIAHSAILGNDKLPAFGPADKSYLKSKTALKSYSIAAMDYAAKLIQGVDDTAMTEEITQFGKKLPRYRALMEVLDHFPWTLGQVVPYLRLNGLTPPMYTPF